MNYMAAVDDCFLDAPGGMGRVAWDIALLMRDCGHRVTLLCARRAADLNRTLPDEFEGIRIIRYDRPVLPAWHPARMARNIDAARRAALPLASTDWGLVHTHSLGTALGVQRAFPRATRFLATVHSPVAPEMHVNWRGQGLLGRFKRILGTPRLNRLEREMLIRSDAIHVLSEYTRTLLQQIHELGNRATVVPHWRRPDLRPNLEKLEARRRLEWPVDKRILFTIRHHGPRYGIDVAIRAVAPLSQAGQCVFYVGGDGPLRPALESLARQCDPSGNIRFTGRLTDEQLGYAYQAADLFLLPTLEMECFGLITTEAFSYGLPVLSTDAGAIPETMRPIQPNFIVPAGDEAALRAKVEAFLTGRLVPPCPADLVDYVARRFDYDVVVPRLIALIESAAAGRAQP